MGELPAAAMARRLRVPRKRYPHRRYLGIADGNGQHWRFLERNAQRQLIDFSTLRNMLAEPKTRIM